MIIFYISIDIDVFLQKQGLESIILTELGPLRLTKWLGGPDVSFTWWLPNNYKRIAPFAWKPGINLPPSQNYGGLHFGGGYHRHLHVFKETPWVDII